MAQCITIGKQEAEKLLSDLPTWPPIRGGNPDKCQGACVIFSSLKFLPNCLWCAVIRTANFANFFHRSCLSFSI
jgi:hypothetical protein